MTIGRDHDGAESGFAAVETIRDKVQGARPGLPVEFQYVVVVPFGKTWAVRWDMAAGFSKVQGEAFVQFIDLHMLHRYYPSHLVAWWVLFVSVTTTGKLTVLATSGGNCLNHV